MVKLADISAHLRASKGERIFIHHQTANALLSSSNKHLIKDRGVELFLSYPCRALIGYAGSWGWYVRSTDLISDM